MRDHEPLPQAQLKDVTLPSVTWNPLTEPRHSITYVDVSAVSRKSLAIETPSVLAGSEAPGRARRIIRTGDTIFATIRPSLRRIAKVTEEYDNQLASTAFCVLRPNQELIDPDFLFFALLTDAVNDRISALQSGASYPAVRDSDVLDQEIPFPVLGEQEEIARLLTFFRSVLTLESNALEKSIALKNALMTMAFTKGLRKEAQRESEIGLVPSSWEVKPFETVREWLQYGTSVPCDSAPAMYPVLRIPNVEAAFVNTADLKYCDLSKDVADRYILSEGDILFIRTNGVRERLGKCAVYSGSPRKALFASYLIRARVHKDVILPRFAAYFFSSQRGTALVAGGATPAADGKFNLNTGTIDSLLVPVPPTLAEQQEIVDILEMIDRKIGLHQEKKHILDDLFHLTLHQLMTGQISISDILMRHSVISPTNEVMV